MKFEVGDNISGQSITTGKYLGLEVMYGKDFHRIYDNTKKMTVFVPIGEEGKLRKLPTKDTVISSLKSFTKDVLIESDQIDGSRYKFFKDKLQLVNFKKSIEVLHDLTLLKKNKEITVSERKLLTSLKDKLLIEISFIMGIDMAMAEEKVTIN
jgi:RNA polymerase-interacting CarD/CdnL/TRCF family regulator